MQQLEMLAEMRVARRQLTAGHIQELMAHGVPSAIIRRYPLIGAELVRVNGDSSCRTYEPCEDGGPAFITPVLVYNAVSPEASGPLATARFNGDIVDLVAWHPARPDQWATRAGAATWLGCIEPQYCEPAPVHIRRSPLAWLQNACVGLVVLSSDPADAYRILTSCHAIKAEDEEHAKELRKAVRQPWPLPRISARDTDRENHKAEDTRARTMVDHA